MQNLLENYYMVSAVGPGPYNETYDLKKIITYTQIKEKNALNYLIG